MLEHRDCRHEMSPNPFDYFLDYFKTNYFTFFFAVTLFFLSVFKYFKFYRIHSTKTALILILLLGLFARIFWLNFSSHETKSAWGSPNLAENDLINIYAIDITNGKWFLDQDGTPSGRRPIGYPLFLALFYKIFGPNLWVADTVNLLLFLVSAYLVFLMTKAIFSEPVALLATLIYCIYPISIYSIALLTDEHLFLPLWYLGLYWLILEIKGRPVRGALVWYGLIFGYATMTRTQVIFMPAVVAVSYWLLRYRWKKILASFIFVALLMQLVNLPWLIRNYKAWGVPVLYTTTAFYIYSYVNSNATPEGGGHIPEKGEEGYSEELERVRLSKNAGRYHVLCNREMTKWIMGHPARFLALGTSRVLIFMGWNRTGVWPIWVQYYEGAYDSARPLPPAVRHFLEEIAYLFYYIIFFSFFISILYLFAQRKALEPQSRISLMMLGLCFLLWCAEQMIIYPDRKYRYPLEPLMIIVASFFLDYVLRTFRWEKLRVKRVNANGA